MATEICACELTAGVQQNKPGSSLVTRIIRDAVTIEKEFVRCVACRAPMGLVDAHSQNCSEALSVALIGMNAELMCTYIEFVAVMCLSRENVFLC